MQISQWKNVPALGGCWRNFIYRITSISPYFRCVWECFFRFYCCFYRSTISFGANNIRRLNVTYSNQSWIEHFDGTVFKEFLFAFLLPQPPSPCESIVCMNILFFTHAWVIEVDLCNDGQCFAVNGEKASPNWCEYRFCMSRLCIQRPKKTP